MWVPQGKTYFISHIWLFGSRLKAFHQWSQCITCDDDDDDYNGEDDDDDDDDDEENPSQRPTIPAWSGQLRLPQKRRGVPLVHC